MPWTFRLQYIYGMNGKSIRIPVPANFNLQECLWFLDRGLDDCMHKVYPGSVRKLVLNGGARVLIELWEKEGHIVVTALKGRISKRQEMIQFLDNWLDFKRDIRPFYRLLEKDKELRILRQKYEGLRIIGIPDLFELLCWCVIGQQINLTFAYRVKRRLVEAYGEHTDYQGQRYYLFPDPQTLSQLKVKDLKRFQLTTRKSEYILGIAQLVADGKLSAKNLEGTGDEKAMIAALTQVRGIGEWTANYTLMKGFRRMNAVPYGDSGLNQALEIFKKIPKKNNREQVDAVFDRFKDWKTYLVFYLWRSRRE